MIDITSPASNNRYARPARQRKQLLSASGGPGIARGLDLYDSRNPGRDFKSPTTQALRPTTRKLAYIHGFSSGAAQWH
jgi:hypothetical protein